MIILDISEFLINFFLFSFGLFFLSVSFIVFYIFYEVIKKD